jgi:hypothetical protein
MARPSDSSKDITMFLHENSKDTTTTMDHSEAPKEKVAEEEVHEEEMVDYEVSPKHLVMEINIFTFYVDNDIIGNDENVMAQFDFRPKETIFLKPKESVNHLKNSLFVRSHIDETLISRMLIYGGTTINLMPYSLY